MDNPIDPFDITEQRKHLGAYIRLHRERLKPEDAGVAATSRRRTTGLRREELAHLCTVSPTWITWLEQGRDVAASADVLARLAQALQLAPAERAYLFDLAGRRDPSAPQVHQPRLAHSVLRSVHAMQCPAYVLDRRWDVVASNVQAADLFLRWGVRTKATVPNLLRFLFTCVRARSLIHDWGARSWRLVAEFRADCGRLADIDPVRALVEELTLASRDFARCWQTHDVLEREGGQRRFHHPRHGDLVYEQLTLHPAVRSDLKLVVLLAAG
jgi:transcriptional regulator with XRE-family HTH domain